MRALFPFPLALVDPCGLRRGSGGWCLARPVDAQQTTVTPTVVHYFEKVGTPPRLVQDAAGNFYGTKTYGGRYGDGSIFRRAPDGIRTLLYSFDGTSRGTVPSTLTPGTDGRFYGSTRGGGSRYLTLASFTVADPSVSAGNDAANLPAAAGNGADNGFIGGNFYRLAAGGAPTILTNFGGGIGSTPTAPLTADGAGSFYGVTGRGGNDPVTGNAGIGTFFKLAPTAR